MVAVCAVFLVILVRNVLVETYLSALPLKYKWVIAIGFGVVIALWTSAVIWWAKARHVREESTRIERIIERDLRTYEANHTTTLVPLAPITLVGMWPDLRWVTCGDCGQREEHETARLSGWHHTRARPTVYKCAACAASSEGRT